MLVHAVITAKYFADIDWHVSRRRWTSSLPGVFSPIASLCMSTASLLQNFSSIVSQYNLTLRNVDVSLMSSQKPPTKSPTVSHSSSVFLHFLRIMRAIMCTAIEQNSVSNQRLEATFLRSAFEGMLFNCKCDRAVNGCTSRQRRFDGGRQSPSRWRYRRRSGVRPTVTDHWRTSCHQLEFIDALNTTVSLSASNVRRHGQYYINNRNVCLQSVLISQQVHECKNKYKAEFIISSAMLTRKKMT